MDEGMAMVTEMSQYPGLLFARLRYGNQVILAKKKPLKNNKLSIPLFNIAERKTVTSL